jgi:hypothetical protein
MTGICTPTVTVKTVCQNVADKTASLWWGRPTVGLGSSTNNDKQTVYHFLFFIE